VQPWFVMILISMSGDRFPYFLIVFSSFPGIGPIGVVSKVRTILMYFCVQNSGVVFIRTKIDLYCSRAL